jgi:hypothetical protein
VKNLMISTESIIEILRLSPQNDITTQSLKGGGGDTKPFVAFVLGESIIRRKGLLVKRKRPEDMRVLSKGVHERPDHS